jgi:dihydroorotase
LEGFASTHGRNFYGYPVRDSQNEGAARVKLRRGKQLVSAERKGDKDVDVVSFWAGKELGWKIVDN